jgi:hypothetical protein
MKLRKFLIIAAAVTAVLAIGGKIGYDIYAPKVFDYIVEKNINALQDTLIEKADDIETLISDAEKKAREENAREETAETPDSSGGTPAKPPSSPEKPKSVRGLSTAELLNIFKNMSSKDKARVISIARSNIPVADIPKFTAMMTEGATSENVKFIKDYFFTKFPASAQEEIFKIFAGYLR